MDVFPNDICFQIDDGSRMFIHEGRIGHRMGNDGNGELTVTDGNDGQTNAVMVIDPFSTMKISISFGMEMVMTRAMPSLAMRAT